jgi:hypothetical protein
MAAKSPTYRNIARRLALAAVATLSLACSLLVAPGDLDPGDDSKGAGTAGAGGSPEGGPAAAGAGGSPEGGAAAAGAGGSPEGGAGTAGAVATPVGCEGVLSFADEDLEDAVRAGGTPETDRLTRRLRSDSPRPRRCVPRLRSGSGRRPVHR